MLRYSGYDEYVGSACVFSLISTVLNVIGKTTYSLL